eukprot:2474099-Prorocentrum_lima.AAC.1
MGHCNHVKAPVSRSGAASCLALPPATVGRSVGVHGPAGEGSKEHGGLLRDALLVQGARVGKVNVEVASKPERSRPRLRLLKFPERVGAVVR